MSCLAPTIGQRAPRALPSEQKNIRDEDMLSRVVSSLISYELSYSMIVVSKCMSKVPVEAEAGQDGLYAA